MNMIEETIDATLDPNGQLTLSQPPRVPPGPVQVTIRAATLARPQRGLAGVVREIAADQRARGFAPVLARLAMSTTISVDEAQAKLKDLIHQLAPGDAVIITENHQPVARLLSEPAKVRLPRRPGNCKGMITLLVEDDEHLQGFTDYMRMKLLLDTHTFLWFITDDRSCMRPKISRIGVRSISGLTGNQMCATMQL